MHSDRNPNADAELAIHALNIHGLFFERRCQQVIRDVGQWELKATNYPVEFPPTRVPLRGKESSSLDIRAELLVKAEQKLTLLIECKKHNLEFVNWIFFPSVGEHRSSGICQIENREVTTHGAMFRWCPDIRVGAAKLDFVSADEFRETRQPYLPSNGSQEERGKDGKQTKTSNATISEAAHQITLARQAIVMEEAHISKALAQNRTPPRAMPWRRQAVVPMIVTTARLWLCRFDPLDVDLGSGEISLSKADLTLWTSPILYEYPVPPHLQLTPADIGSAVETGLQNLFVRMHILIVQGERLGEVLLKIKSNPGAYLKDLRPAEFVSY